MRNVFLIVVAASVCGCGIYSFTGSSLPSYMKTVDVPLFLNESLKPGVAEELTTAISNKVLSNNLLRVVSSGGDATVEGKVVEYKNHPYTYDSKAVRDVDVSEYVVSITAIVRFMDNRKGESVYEGTVIGEGVYSFESGTEDEGRRKAVEDVAEQIVQNSVQGW